MARSSFEGSASIHTWAYRIALNTAISFVRKKRTRRDYHDRYRREKVSRRGRRQTRPGDRNPRNAPLTLRCHIPILIHQKKPSFPCTWRISATRRSPDVTDITENHVGVKLHRIKKNSHKSSRKKMELDDLKDTWKRQKAAAGASYSRSKLLMLINNRMISFEERIRSRDRLEILACIVVIICFGAYFFVTESLLQAGGQRWCRWAGPCWSGTCSQDRRRAPCGAAADGGPAHGRAPGAGAGGGARAEEAPGSIAWWYILPLTVGLLLFALGFQSGPAFKAGYIALVLAMGAGYGNATGTRCAANSSPLEKELEEAMEFIRDGEES
ncbi:MAG: hypothetical protein U5K31_09500 [Balneolaceae bacterium]|nr:hypothetical protein [Balneolaceae bacterium]